MRKHTEFKSCTPGMNMLGCWSFRGTIKIQKKKVRCNSGIGENPLLIVDCFGESE